jgi:gamma-butyrobetaine dioxygenase
VKAPATVEELFALYEAKGHLHYGELVTGLEHGLQCAALARAQGATDALIAAALFHDVGWLVTDVGGDEGFAPIDDDHAALGARVLSPIFGPAVAQPVALHVTAKRWRCTIDPDYFDELSPASQETFIVQGGSLNHDERMHFESHPGFEAALALRSWDDTAKTLELETGVLRDYEALVRGLATWSAPPPRDLAFPALWLRDNCPCDCCRDPRSSQKLFQITELPEGLSLADVQVTGDQVVVRFSPDDHRSVFSRAWLAAQSPGGRGDGRTEQDKQLWRAGDLDPDAQRSDWPTYCNDDNERLRILRGIERLGFAVIHNTPTVDGTVLEVVRTFGFVRATNYGELFEVRVEANPNNLAFTGLAISPHTDNPYRDPVPTMQLLHCLSSNVDGGESGLVDGFLASAILRDECPKYFDVLASTPVTFAWSDEHNYLRAQRPIIEVDPLGRIRGVRFNNRSMQALRLDFDNVAEYYDAYRYFADIIARPDLLLTFRLEPGDCLIFDNTRLLHARTAFVESSAGRRHLQGCYTDLDGLASAIAVLDRVNSVRNRSNISMAREVDHHQRTNRI